MKILLRYGLVATLAITLPAGLVDAAAEQAQNPMTLHVFRLRSNGVAPHGLIRGPDGSYYGTTGVGGIGFPGHGTFYRIDASTGRFSLLHQFDPTIDGCQFPQESDLALGSDGNFYGLGYPSPSSAGQGCLFRLSATGEYTTVYTFDKGDSRDSVLYNLVEDAQGNWYGIGTEGTFRCGVIFELTHDGVFNTLHNFTCGSDGGEPAAPLLLASDGNLYGSTRFGGADLGVGGAGTLFRITPTGTFTTLHEFDYSTERGDPEQALVEAPGGVLYGTTSGDVPIGTQHEGTFFRMTLDGEVTTLYLFPYGPNGLPDPSTSALTLMPDGNFYGVRGNDGIAGAGTIYRISPSGAYSELYAFTGQGRNGSDPESALVVGVDNALYSTTTSSGSRSAGTVFRYVPPPAQ